MAKFVQYTCNKKNVPVLRKDCEKCREYNPCAKDGKWCFLGALVAEHDPILAEASMPLTESAIAPSLRDTSTVTIKLGNGMKVDVLKEDIKKQLEHSFYNAPGFWRGT